MDSPDKPIPPVPQAAAFDLKAWGDKAIQQAAANLRAQTLPLPFDLKEWSRKAAEEAAANLREQTRPKDGEA